MRRYLLGLKKAVSLVASFTTSQAIGDVPFAAALTPRMTRLICVRSRLSSSVSEKLPAVSHDGLSLPQHRLWPCPQKARSQD